MQENFALRSRVAMAIRNYLVGEGFLEIETPFMTRSTPEGARDYLVPSRVQPGSFYALPQSPQIFKQILMVSGFDRYFQIARCFRDEDLRADRQPEFTQIDLEISFPQMDTVFRVTEGFLTAAFAAAGIQLAPPFVRMTYDEAIRNYGIDKPDMRLPAMVSLSEILTPELRDKLKIEQALPVLGFVIPHAGELSGTARKSLLSEVRAGFGDCGLDLLDLVRLKTNPEFAPLAEKITDELSRDSDDFLASMSTKLIPVDLHDCRHAQAGHARNVELRSTVDMETRRRTPPRTRRKVRRQAQASSTKTGTAADFKFCWVTDFPMYEWNEETKTWDAAHHPFTSPHEDDIRPAASPATRGPSAPSPTTSSSTATSLARDRSVSIARTCRPRSSAPSACPTKRPTNASASSSTHWSTARLRTAASPSASTASS